MNNWLKKYIASLEKEAVLDYFEFNKVLTIKRSDIEDITIEYLTSQFMENELIEYICQIKNHKKKVKEINKAIKKIDFDDYSLEMLNREKKGRGFKMEKRQYHTFKGYEFCISKCFSDPSVYELVVVKLNNDFIEENFIEHEEFDNFNDLHKYLILHYDLVIFEKDFKSLDK